LESEAEHWSKAGVLGNIASAGKSGERLSQQGAQKYIDDLKKQIAK
jgi:hypothetical protein